MALLALYCFGYTVVARHFRVCYPTADRPFASRREHLAHCAAALNAKAAPERLARRG
jgi:hypothetical protein